MTDRADVARALAYLCESWESHERMLKARIDAARADAADYRRLLAELVAAQRGCNAMVAQPDGTMASCKKPATYEDQGGGGSCDDHLDEEEWDELPHASALRAACAKIGMP